MKVTFKETTTKEVEIKTPSFWKSGDYYFHLINEGSCIRASTFDKCEGINQGSICIWFDYNNNAAVEITRDEFMEAFAKVNQILTEKVREHFN